MTDDAQLLRRYAEDNSEAAFAELVHRHLGWVYRTGLRRTGGRTDLAQDAAQQVFIALARQAAALARREVLAGWLHVATRYAACQALRAEARRKHHEADAADMSADAETLGSRDWAALRPIIDREIDRLSAGERDAVVLRFFEGKSFAEIAARLRIGEDGARKRVERALEKMGVRLGRAGITSSAAALGGMLRAEALHPLPAGVHTVVTHAALSSSPLAAATPLMQLMSATKAAWATAAMVGLATIVGLSTATFAVIEARRAADAKGSYTAASQRYQASQQTLRASERAAAAATSELAAARTKHADQLAALEKAKANAEAAAAKRAAQRGPDPKTMRSDGQAFLAQYSGAKALLMEIGKAQIERGTGVFFKQQKMTPDQIDAWETQTAQHWLDTIEVTPNSMHPGEGNLPDDRIAALIGDDGLQAYKDFARARPAQGWAGGLATVAAQAGAPISPDAIAALSQAVVQNSPEYAKGGAIQPAKVDWTKTIAQAQQALSPEQWQAVQPMIQLQQLKLQAQQLAGVKEGPGP